MKIDIHTNLETFPTSQSSDTLIYCSVDDTVRFLIENEIDVNFCLYPRDEYHKLEELANATPNIKHIGVQVLMGKSAEDATRMDKLQLDVCDSSKSFTSGGLCYGIKIASHRGWWKRTKQEYVEAVDFSGKRTGLFQKQIVDATCSGFSYGPSDSRFITGKGGSAQLTKWLNQMPENSICSMHMQGDPIQGSSSMPYTVGMFAFKNPHLKFIINHCGDFGQGGLSNKPKNYVTKNKSDGNDNYFPAYRHAHSKGLILSAVQLANDLHNVMLDTSVHTPFKGEMMRDCKRWAVGSDYPFQVKDTSKSSNLFTAQYNKFVKDCGQDVVEAAQHTAYRWLTADWKELRDEHAKSY